MRRKLLFLRKALSENILGFRRGLRKDIRIESNMFPGLIRLQREFIWCHIPRRLEQIGKKEMMYQKTKLGWKPDNFCHEQSLVLDTDSGLVIFNSCSHGGVVNIINGGKSCISGTKNYCINWRFSHLQASGSGNPGARKINKRNRNSVYLHRTLLEGKRL